MARRVVSREVREVAAALHDYDDEYLTCRNLGHYWRVVGYFRGASGTTTRRLECQRCETTRVDLWASVGGERIGARYRYGADYRLEGVQPPASAVRVEVLRRATVYASEDEMLSALATSNGGRRR
jgi:hypothetical protein